METGIIAMSKLHQMLLFTAAIALPACSVPVHDNELLGRPPPEALRTSTTPPPAGTCQVPWQSLEQLVGRSNSGATQQPVDAVDIVKARLDVDNSAISAVMLPILYTIRGHIGGGGDVAGTQYNPPNLSVWDLRNFAAAIHDKLKHVRQTTALATLQAAPGSPLDQELHLFEDALGFYFTRLFRGTYVDRFGDKLAAPAFSRTVGDSEIASTINVLIDVIVDFSVRSPIWTEGTGTKEVYYPAQKANPGVTPTAVAFMTDPTMLQHYGTNQHFLHWVLEKPIPESGAATGCGMDEQKVDVVEYLAQLAQQEASGITGLTLGTAGGFGVSLGAFGKFSIGDNQTVQVLARTVLSIAADRIISELAYRAVYTIPDKDLAFSDTAEKAINTLTGK